MGALQLRLARTESLRSAKKRPIGKIKTEGFKNLFLFLLRFVFKALGMAIYVILIVILPQCPTELNKSHKKSNRFDGPIGPPLL